MAEREFGLEACRRRQRWDISVGGSSSVFERLRIDDRGLIPGGGLEPSWDDGARALGTGSCSGCFGGGGGAGKGDADAGWVIGVLLRREWILSL